MGADVASDTATCLVSFVWHGSVEEKTFYGNDADADAVAFRSQAKWLDSCGFVRRCQGLWSYDCVDSK